VGLIANEGRAPGDYNWDPLNLKSTLKVDSEEKAQLFALRELKNGRLAMVSVAGILIQEYLTGQSWLDQISSGHLSPFNDGQGAF